MKVNTSRLPVGGLRPVGGLSSSPVLLELGSLVWALPPRLVGFPPVRLGMVFRHVEGPCLVEFLPVRLGLGSKFLSRGGSSSRGVSSGSSGAGLSSRGGSPVVSSFA